MDILCVRTDGDDIYLGKCALYKTAFEACVDAHYLRRFAVELFVGLFILFLKSGVFRHVPAGVSVAVGAFRSLYKFREAVEGVLNCIKSLFR